MGKAKATSLLDDVLGRVVPGRPGFGTWFTRLPAEAQAEFEAVRQSFDPAKHQKRAFARAVIAAAQERGYDIAGIQGVIDWLQGGKR